MIVLQIALSIAASLCHLAISQKQITIDPDLAVNEHNKYRKQVASGQVAGQPAGQIPDLKWNQELADIAYGWVSKCKFDHNYKGRYQKKEFGENLAGGTDQGAEQDVKNAVKMWFDEHKKYRYPAGFSISTGHYTQVVWGDTTDVGCGAALCGKDYILACDYYPPGNYPEPPYKKA